MKKMSKGEALKFIKANPNMGKVETSRKTGLSPRRIGELRAELGLKHLPSGMARKADDLGLNKLLKRLKDEPPTKGVKHVKEKLITKNEGLERILFIPDCHVPYHDVLAYNLMMKVAKDFKPDHVIILGDYADFYAVSAHDKNPKRANQLDEEVSKAVDMLWEIKDLGAKNNVFISGNHEDRLTRYLMQKAPALWKSISIQSVLALDKIGFEFVPYRSHYQLGKLFVTHDTGKSGVYAHKQALDAFHRSIVIGHTHRFGQIIQGDANGDKHVGAMFGWLGDVSQVDYMHNINAIKDWTLGFGVGYLNPKNGYVYLQPVPIVRYSCVLNGVLYES